MNNKDRKIFWETLTSLTGQNIPEECRKLTETIKYPKKLYRFRKADTNSLEAMRTNRLFFLLLSIMMIHLTRFVQLTGIL